MQLVLGRMKQSQVHMSCFLTCWSLYNHTMLTTIHRYIVTSISIHLRKLLIKIMQLVINVHQVGQPKIFRVCLIYMDIFVWWWLANFSYVAIMKKPLDMFHLKHILENNFPFKAFESKVLSPKCDKMKWHYRWYHFVTKLV